MLDVVFSSGCLFQQTLSSQNDIIHIESDSSVEFGARRVDANAGHEQAPETSNAATQCPGEVVDDGQRRRVMSVSAVENSSVSQRKSSVSSNAADLLAKLVCLRRKMKLTDNATVVV